MSSLLPTCMGLVLDGSPLESPKGSLYVAENVVCDLPAIIRGRPNFTRGVAKSTTYVPTAMHIFGSTPIVVAKDGSNWRIETDVGSITGAAEPVDFDARETSFAEARGSLYHCTSTGVRALRTSGDGATGAAGVDFALGLSLGRDALAMDTAIPGPFGTGDWAYAHCMVVKRTDANGYIKRSPPSVKVFRVDTVGVGQTASIVLAAGPVSGNRACIFPTGTLEAGDEVEFYRTLVVAWTSNMSLPSDMYRVLTYRITATDISNGYFPPSQVELLDQKENEALGEALYTNPQREGVLGTKAAPPIAQEIALWNSCMWYGRTKTRHRVALSFDAVGDNVGANYFEPTDDSFGRRETTGDVAVSTTITNVVDVTGVVPGMYVAATAGSGPFESPSSSVIPAGTTVVSISGAGPYSVVISQAGTGISAGLAITFCDKVVVDGVPFAGWNTQPMQVAASGGRQTFRLGNFADAYSGQANAAANLCRVINDAYAAGTIAVRAIPSIGATYDGTGGFFLGSAGFILERTTPSGASFTVTTTKPMALSPQVSSGVVSAQENVQNRVYYSLPDEPEAVPLLNFFDVGSQGSPIQRLIPLRDSLLVFKEDGLFRVTGSYPNWSVSQIDTKMRLVRPEACAALGDLCYAWTNRGVLEIDESGERRNLSVGRLETDLFSPQGAILSDDAYHGCRILTSGRHQLVLLTLPNTAAASPLYYSTTVYCWAAKTGLWTKWPSLFVRCGAERSDGVLVTANNNSLNELEWETRVLTDTPRGYDVSFTGLSWTDTASSTALSITNAQRGDWVPKAGDWVAWTIAAQVLWRRVLTATATGGGNYSMVLDSAAPADVASATNRQAVESTPTVIEWQPSALGTHGVSLGPNREVIFQMDGVASTKVAPTDFRVTLAVRNDQSDDLSLATVTGTPTRQSVLRRPYRMGWPRNGSRRAIVGPRLSWSEIDWDWRLMTVVLVGEPGNERVRR